MTHIPPSHPLKAHDSSSLQHKRGVRRLPLILGHVIPKRNHIHDHSPTPPSPWQPRPHLGSQCRSGLPQVSHQGSAPCLPCFMQHVSEIHLSCCRISSWLLLLLRRIPFQGRSTVCPVTSGWASGLFPIWGD